MKIYLSVQMAFLSGLAIFFAFRILKIPFHFVLLAVLPLTLVWLPGLHQMIPWYDVDAVFFSFLALCALGTAFSADCKSKFTFLFVAGICSSLSFLSKQNIGGGSIIASFAFIFLQPTDIRTKLKDTTIFSFGISFPLIAIVFYFLYNNALSEALQWMIHRAGSRYGEGGLIRTMWQFNIEALAGPRNNFLKFIFPFYLWSIYITWKKREDKSCNGNVAFGVAIFSLIVMWIGILQEGGKRYSIQQVYLGLLSGILLSFTPYFKGSGFLSTFKKPQAIFLSASLFLMFFWGAATRWRQPYDSKEIRWTVNQQKIKGLYFRKSDYEVLKDLLEFEKNIPKNERIFIMPDPLFFYFATDRLSPVPLTHFQVSGWELNDQEQKLVPEFLMKENVKWIFIGQEQYFDTGFMRFGLQEDWKTAVQKNVAMMSRSNYTELRNFIDAHYTEVPGPKGFWVLKRNG